MTILHPRSLVGGEFKGMTALSAFGRIYRLSRLNSLSFRQAVDVLGVPNAIRNQVRSYGTFRWPEVAAWDRLPVHSDWPSVEDLALCPANHSLCIDDRIRGCPTCLRSGFHAVLHQLPWISDCPWHRETLTDRCHCGRPLLDRAWHAADRLLECKCGHDHYDRKAALRSLSDWPEAEVIRAIQDYLAEVRRLPASHRLITDGELSTDRAMATAHGLGISESFLIAAEVFSCHEDETEGDLEGGIIRCWDGISRPDQGHSIPLLPEDTLTLHSFAKTLFQRIRTSTAGVRLGPFEKFRGEVTYDRRPISQIDSVYTYNLSHRDIRVGRTLINRFVDKLAPKSSDDWVTWQARRTAALKQQSAERHLLARTLSAMGALALMEQWTIQGWRAYAEEEGPGLQIFGHPLILLHEGPRPTAKVIRAMAVPEFKDPTPEQAISYRFASARYGGIHSSYYWEA